MKSFYFTNFYTFINNNNNNNNSNSDMINNDLTNDFDKVVASENESDNNKNHNKKNNNNNNNYDKDNNNINLPNILCRDLLTVSLYSLILPINYNNNNIITDIILNYYINNHYV